MPFIPATKMWERVEVARQESDTALFFHLLYCGEMVTKLVTAGLVAAVGDDEGQQYRQIHRLVRADGLGEWVQVIDEMLTGPAAQHLLTEASEERRELTQRCGAGTWQYDATRLIHQCLRVVEPQCEALPAKVALRNWFIFFAELRNKTRGHGAPPGSDLSRMCADLNSLSASYWNTIASFSVRGRISIRTCLESIVSPD